MALLWENHERHIAARRWLSRVERFSTCPLTQLGFARISSHPLLGYGMVPEDAFALLRRFTADPRHQFIADDLSCQDRVLRTEKLRGANEITDHYLIALARAHSCLFATLDETLARQCLAEQCPVELVC
jgi:uncharacterized protein